MTPPLTQQWLRQVIGPYNNQDRVYTDVDSALTTYPTLRPKTDVYTFDDGRQQLLLCIHGLLPISFKETTYNIPVALWLALNYPRDPPLTYVVPTGDMLVKASKDVDLSGRCRMGYILDWERKSEGCTLASLLESMQDIFSREPPVYAKPKGPPVAGPSQQPQSPAQSSQPTSPRPPEGPPPVPAVPEGYQSPLMHPAFDEHGRPMLPPKPAMTNIFTQTEAPSTLPGNAATLANRPPPPLPGGSVQPSPPPVAHQPLRPLNRPPPPPWAQAFHPPETRSSSGSVPSVPQSPVTASTPHHTAAYYAGQGRGPANPAAGSSISTPGSPRESISGVISPSPHQSGLAPSPFRPHRPPPPPVPAVPPPPPIQALPPAPPPAPPAPNLLDADDDTAAEEPPEDFAPPRPMNPELLRIHDTVYQRIVAELTTFTATVTEDGERLRAMQGDLLQGEPAIHDEMARLVAVRDVCKSVGERLRGTVQAAEANIQELKRKGDPEVDELVCSTTIVYNQLVDLVAEDNAIEDTMYHLHRALNSGRIDLDRFVRTTRVLAEEQFMKRALIQKITSGIPMGVSMNWG